LKRYIASDFHNGNEVADYDRVMAFLDLVDDDADEFLILGDWEELLWSNMNILTTVKPYSYVTEKVKAIARKKTTRVIVGNHDWPLDFFASTIAPIKAIAPFNENGVYFCHGHDFDWLSFITGTLVDPIYWKRKFSIISLPLWLATKAWEVAEDNYHWGILLIHERVRDYAAKNGYHTVILGHTHFPVVEVRGGIQIYNVGDMLDSYSHLVQEDGRIELKYF